MNPLGLSSAGNDPSTWGTGVKMAIHSMVNVDLYSAIIMKVSNAMNTLVSGEKTGFQTQDS